MTRLACGFNWHMSYPSRPYATLQFFPETADKSVVVLRRPLWISLRSPLQWLVIGAVLLGVATWLASRHVSGEPTRRVYRIGFQHSPPRQYVDDHKRPYGSTIDLISQGKAFRHRA